MIPFVGRDQAEKLDQLMASHFNISVDMMMELAGYQIARFVRDNFDSKDVLICCGKGNNGGDGLAAARHLKNFGFQPKIYLASKDLSMHAQKYLKVAEIQKIPFVERIKKHDIVLDCLIGYHLKGNPRHPFHNLIEDVNETETIVSVDIPSGVDADKGVTYDPYVKATHILFLSLPKRGCSGFPAKMYVADIGVPRQLYSMIDVSADDYFKDESIVSL